MIYTLLISPSVELLKNSNSRSSHCSNTSLEPKPASPDVLARLDLPSTFFFNFPIQSRRSSHFVYFQPILKVFKLVLTCKYQSVQASFEWVITELKKVTFCKTCLDTQYVYHHDYGVLENCPIMILVTTSMQYPASHMSSIIPLHF